MSSEKTIPSTVELYVGPALAADDDLLPDERENFLTKARHYVEAGGGDPADLRDAVRAALAHLPALEFLGLAHTEPTREHALESPAMEKSGDSPSLEEFPDGSCWYSDGGAHEFWYSFGGFCAERELDARYPWLSESQGADLDTWVSEWNSHQQEESASGKGDYDFSWSQARRGRAALVDIWCGENVEGECYRLHLVLLAEGITLADADDYVGSPLEQESQAVLGRAVHLVTFDTAGHATLRE